MTGTEIERREASDAVGAPLPPMSDAEFAGLWRTARGLAESGLFKDATRAGQAFAKILAGRDLGLTPFEAMAGLHVIEGKVEAGADLHATRVRGREGYDYRVAWIKQTPKTASAPPIREAVWADEEDPLDLREVVGCVLLFTVDGEQRGISRWTVEDSVRAGKTGGNHQKYPRNMYFARAMTNGVAWFVPEVMGGLRVYGHGEIPAPADLTDTGQEDVFVDLPSPVEAIVARARTLGHAGLSNRQAVAMTVNGQPGEYVEAWVRNATGELNRMAAGRPEAEPVDADAVEVTAEPTPLQDAARRSRDQAGLASPEALETPLPSDPAGTPDHAPEPVAAPQAPAAPAEPGESPEAPLDPERVEAMKRRALQLLDDADAFDADGQTERAADARGEAEAMMAQVEAVSDPAQDSLGF